MFTDMSFEHHVLLLLLLHFKDSFVSNQIVSDILWTCSDNITPHSFFLPFELHAMLAVPLLTYFHTFFYTVNLTWMEFSITIKHIGPTLPINSLFYPWWQNGCAQRQWKKKLQYWNTDTKIQFNGSFYGKQLSKFFFLSLQWKKRNDNNE